MIFEQIKKCVDPVRAMTDEEAKEIKKEYASWESYKINLVERAAGKRHEKK